MENITSYFNGCFGNLYCIFNVTIEEKFWLLYSDYNDELVTRFTKNIIETQNSNYDETIEGKIYYNKI